MDLNLNFSINDGGDPIMLISAIYDVCQSWMIDVIYCGYPSLKNMMDVHHLWMRWISFMYDVRRYWFIDWIEGTGERETIDQGLDGIKGKDKNEEIRTMALMEFIKLIEPTQLIYMIFIQSIHDTAE